MKITENEIKKLIKESVFKILKEYQEKDEAGEILHRGDKVLLYGYYPAIVCQDEEPSFEGEIVNIKLTRTDTFNTPWEKRSYDWFPRNEIEKI